jgi:hypothetical protein
LCRTTPAIIANLLDLETLVAGTGRERTTARYRELLARAGLRLHRIVPTVGLPSVIEAPVA